MSDRIGSCPDFNISRGTYDFMCMVRPLGCVPIPCFARGWTVLVHMGYL